MFQEIRNKLGQKDDKGYQVKTKVTAIIKRVKNVEYSKASGKPGQSLLIEVNGEEEWIKLIGKFDALDGSFEGRNFEFLIWPFQPDGSPKSYLYAWIQRQSGAQTPPQAHQATNTPAGGINHALALCDQLRLAIASLGGQPNPQYEEKPQQVEESDLIPF